MSRAVAEWIGATPDTAVPGRVRVRVFNAKNGRCHSCTRKIPAGEAWTCEHMTALVNGGANRESNLDVTCGWCLPAKNAADVAEKSKVYTKRKKHIGLRKPSRMPGSRHSRFKKKIDGSVVLRDAR